MQKHASNIADQKEQPRIIHRIVPLSLGEQIIFIGVNSLHRANAFATAIFIMNFLKMDTPFLRKKITSTGEAWADGKKRR